MKTIIKIFLGLYIFFLGLTFSQDTSIVKYFPLKVGNVWVYSGQASVYTQCSRTFYQRIFIDSVKIIENKTYYKLNFLERHISGTGTCGYVYLSTGYYRIDSVSGNIYRQRIDPVCTYHVNKILIDSLRSRMNDTAKICSGGSYFRKILRDTFYTTVFSVQKQTKKFDGGNFFEYIFSGRYAKEFGLIECRESGMSVTSYIWLRGCIVNDVMYGDTSYYPVGLNHISNEVPVNFSLSQNYPNPFNPSTQINFDIPVSSLVTLNFFDAIGRLIEQPVNEELNPGSYNYEWDASSYSSGIYFYKISAGNYSETRKMVLIK